MINIAVCEDELIFSKKISMEIEKFFEDYEAECSIEVFNSADRLIERIDKVSFNIYFMDIEIGDRDGVRVAEYIRKIDKNAVLIFVTNKNERVYEVFSLDTFGFVRKDHFDADFPQMMDRLSKEVDKYISKYIIQGKDKEYLMTINDIIYTERVGGAIVIRTSDVEIETRYRYFTELPFSVNEEYFGEIYRGIFINYKYLEGIDTDNVRMTGGFKLPIARRKKKIIKEEYKNYLLNS